MEVPVDIQEYSLKANKDDNVLGEYCHFKVHEFACHDGSDKVLIDKKLVAWLEYIRSILDNKPIYINSGYRTPSYNKKIGGATNSYHMKGQAADIHSNHFQPIDIALAAESLNIPGIILYKNFVHIDTRPKKYWGTSTGNGKYTAVKTFIGVKV